MLSAVEGTPADNVGACLRVRPALRSSAEVAVIKAALSRNPFFGDWDDVSLQLISGVLGHASAGSGELLIQRGEAVSGVYIVLYGTCDVAVPHPTNPRGRAEYRGLHAGNVCGLEALLSDDHRAAAAVTAGPAGVELAVLGSSAWADVCTRAAAGGPPAAKWAALRTTLLCTFVRQHAAAAPQRAAGGSAAGGVGGGKSGGQQPGAEAAGGGAQGGRGGIKWDAEVELASAVEVDAAAAGAEDGPYELLRQERLALLLACFPGTSLSAMPHALLLEAARGCMLRPLKPYTPLYTVNGAHNSQAVLLAGGLQVRSQRPFGRSGSRAPARPGAGPAPAAGSGVSGTTPARDSASSVGKALEAGAGAGAAADATPGGADATAAAAAAGADEAGPSEAAAGEELEELEEAEEGDDVAAATASGDTETEAGDDGVDAVAGLEPAGAGGKAQVSAEEAERRLTERFGPVVGSEGPGASLCELSLGAITGAKGRRPPRRTSLVTGAAPALVLVIPVAALRRGYGAARSALVAARTAALLRPGAWGALGEALRGGCLNPAELSALALAASPARLAAGALVARQGAPIDALYLVQEGELRLLDDPDSATQQQQQEQAAAAAQPPASAFAMAATSSSVPSGAGPSAVLASLLADSVIGSELSPLFARREGDAAVVPGGSSAAAAATAAVTAAAAALGGSAVGASASQVAAALKNLPSIMTVNAGGVFGAGLLGYPADADADKLRRGSGGGGGAGGSGSLPMLLPSPPVGPPPGGLRGASMTGGRPQGPASPLLVGRNGAGGSSSSGATRTADGGAGSSSGGAGGGGAVASVSLSGAAPSSPSLMPQPPNLGRTPSRPAAEAAAQLLQKSPSHKAMPSLRRSVSISVPEAQGTEAPGPSAPAANAPRAQQNAGTLASTAPPSSSLATAQPQQSAGASSGAAAATPVKVQQGRFPATAVAVGAVRLLVLPREALLRLAPVLGPLLLEMAAQHMEMLERRRTEAQDMHTKLPQVITVEGLPAAPVVRDPYAVTRRRAAERKAAVESLMHEGAPVVRAPEVLPPEQVLARPSLLLERMGFKVPKVRGLTSGTASGGESEPASGEPSPGGQLVARAGSITGACSAGGGGGGGGPELPLAHAASLGSAGIGGSSGSPHSPHIQYRSRLSGSGVPGAPGVLGSMHLVPGPPQASSPMRFSAAGTGPSGAGGGTSAAHLLHLPRVHTASSSGLDSAFPDPGLQGPQASFSSQCLGATKHHNAHLHGALTQRGPGGGGGHGGDGPATAPGSPSAGLPRLRVSASGVHDSPMRQRLTAAGLMGTGTPGTASPVARYSSNGLIAPSSGYGGAPAAAQVAAALGLTGGGVGSGIASRTHSFSTPGLPLHLMPQLAGPAGSGGSFTSQLPPPMRLLVSVGSGGLAGGGGSTPCSPSAKHAPRAQASPMITPADTVGKNGGEGPEGSRLPTLTSSGSGGSRPPLAPQPPADAATAATAPAFTAGAYAAAAREAAAVKGAAAAAEAAAWMSQLDGGRRSDNGLLRRTAVVASAAATATGAGARAAAHGGAGELSAAAALAVLGGSAGGGGGRKG